MNVKARITDVMPVRESANGFQWQEFVCEYYEPFATRPDRLLLKLLGEDKIKSTGLKVGDVYAINFGHNVSEYKGHRYNELKVFTIAPWKETEAPQAEPAPVEQQATETTTPVAPVESDSEQTNDLPF